ncbi:MAG: VWA domain-containing protein [Planctomycetota bacterium]
MPTLADPAWLVLMALAIPSGWLLLRFARTMPRSRRWVASGVRALLLASLALLLAGASSVRETSRLAVILVVDISESVDRYATPGTDEQGRPIALQAEVRRLVRQLDQARGPDDLLGIVAFAERPVAIATPTTARIADRAIEPVSSDGTDIAGAIDFARSLIPPDATGRILLITDGNETTGDAVLAAERAATGVGALTLDALPVEYRVAGETLVEAVVPPARARSDSTVPVRVEIATTQGTSGVLRLFRDGVEVDLNPAEAESGRRIELPPGRHVVLLESPVGSGRLSRFRAAFEPDAQAAGSYAGDAQLDNNSAEAFTISPGLGQVLVVTPTGETNTGTATIAQALAETTRDVQTTNASALPADLLELQDYDLVVLNNVPADEVSPRAQRALAAHVTDAGAGLVMVGGRASFGAGGWAGTPLEPILPVHLDLGERLVERRTAIVFVLDSSGSMGANVGGSFSSQQEIANAAAAGAAATLGPTDLVGVVSFSSSARWVVPLADNGDPDRTAAAITAISSGGGTDLPPALRLAQQALAPVEAAVKHVIVLSDGRSVGAETLPDIARSMAADDINVSTISVGDQADLDTMFAVAERGGGVHYPVTNPSVLPRVFVRAVRLIRDPLIKEGEIPLRRLTEATPLLDRSISLPGIGGLVLTRFREDPTVVNVLATAEDEPVLAHWNAGLGRVAAFTADAREWSRAWIAAGTFDSMWGRIAQSIARPADASDLELSTVITDGMLEARLTAADDQGNPLGALTVRANVYTPSGDAVPVVLDQVAPGEYAASIPASQAGNYIAVVRPTGADGPMLPVLGGTTQTTSLEHQTLESNRRRVEQIAAAANGSVLTFQSTVPSQFFDRSTVTPRRAESPLRDELLIAALALLLLDVAARRVAWDRFIGERTANASSVPTAQTDLASLKNAAKRAKPQQAAALSDTDAAEVARQARRRRADARRAQKAPPAAQPAEAEQPPPSPGPRVVEEQPPGGDAGLLAAKRRARERFEQGD